MKNMKFSRRKHVSMISPVLWHNYYKFSLLEIFIYIDTNSSLSNLFWCKLLSEQIKLWRNASFYFTHFCCFLSSGEVESISVYHFFQSYAVIKKKKKKKCRNRSRLFIKNGLFSRHPNYSCSFIPPLSMQWQLPVIRWIVKRLWIAFP